MKQEDLNSMMKYPWEISRTSTARHLKTCPNCELEYMGNGIDLCLEREFESQKSKNKLVGRTE